MSIDKQTQLKRLADLERVARTTLIKKYLSESSHSVCLGTFLFGHSDLLQCVSEQRRIYLAVGEADINQTKSDSNSDPARFTWVRSDLATKAAGKCLLRVVPNHHLKYILTDPYTDKARGLLLTTNLTPSGVDVEDPVHSRLSSHEIVLSLENSEVNDLTNLVKYIFFGTSGVREFKKGVIDPVLPLNISFIEPVNLLANILDSFVLTETILALISSAKVSLKICSYTFDLDSPIFSILKNLRLSNVDITIILNDNNDNLRVATKLKELGVKVLIVQRMHAKAVLVDNNRGIVCTANLCKKGLSTGINIGVKCSEQNHERLELLQNFFYNRINLPNLDINKTTPNT